MITYISPKFNEICSEIKEILLKNNINLADSEQLLDNNIITQLEQHVAGVLQPVSKFINVPCPKCGKTHLIPMESSYSRKIIFKVENILIKLNITVPRLKCTNCGSTHAVLPSFCVPFKQYSKQAILEIVSEASETSTQTVADNLNIDSKQVRRFVNVFQSFANDTSLIFHMYPNKFHCSIDNDSKLHIIVQSLPYDFDALYFREFRKIYLYIENKRKIYMRTKKLSH